MIILVYTYFFSFLDQKGDFFCCYCPYMLNPSSNFAEVAAEAIFFLQLTHLFVGLREWNLKYWRLLKLEGERLSFEP